MDNFQRLSESIIEMSIADNFEEAKKEWRLTGIYKGDAICLCGHSPITNICVLTNKLNSQQTIVGSTCVQKFIGLPAKDIFLSVNMIVKDIKNYLCLELIEYLHEQKIINDWEFAFLKDTHKKRYLSDKQMAKRVEINQRLLKYLDEKAKSGSQD